MKVDVLGLIYRFWVDLFAKPTTNLKFHWKVVKNAKQKWVLFQKRLGPCIVLFQKGLGPILANQRSVCTHDWPQNCGLSNWLSCILGSSQTALAICNWCCVRMYVSVCVCVCVCVLGVHARTRMCVYVHDLAVNWWSECLYSYEHVCILKCLCVCMYVCMYVLCVCVCVCVR